MYYFVNQKRDLQIIKNSFLLIIINLQNINTDLK